MSPLAWRKSSFSTGSQSECVELAPGPGGAIHFRESDDPDVVAATTPTTLRTFVRAAKAGAFDHVT
ncbi:DUF397 domain-containing protein [Streptomyces sp. XD-27]|uniref:DUF397 domain-containing protein n=1 Tax=Streptomyces sp. XD-27 TaxID=3062779 RepID=UPI0026F47C47|nr:DUF397 domain-containing protein [Streptomyces sp. XD-27]WKX72572.1 DUF397 domain-containing protein [Streptomyces sp. XD-27]